MNIYRCMLERRVLIEYVEIWPRYELRGALALIVAPTRGKARAIFADFIDEEFTYPMSIKKLNHSIPQCELTEGVSTYDLLEDNRLLPDSELDNYLETMFPQDEPASENTEDG